MLTSYPDSIHSGANDRKRDSTTRVVGANASRSAYGGESVFSTLSTGPTNITIPYPYNYNVENESMMVVKSQTNYHRPHLANLGRLPWI